MEKEATSSVGSSDSVRDHIVFTLLAEVDSNHGCHNHKDMGITDTQTGQLKCDVWTRGDHPSKDTAYDYSLEGGGENGGPLLINSKYLDWKVYSNVLYILTKLSAIPLKFVFVSFIYLFIFLQKHRIRPLKAWRPQTHRRWYEKCAPGNESQNRNGEKMCPVKLTTPGQHSHPTLKHNKKNLLCPPACTHLLDMNEWQNHPARNELWHLIGTHSE